MPMNEVEMPDSSFTPLFLYHHHINSTAPFLFGANTFQEMDANHDGHLSNNEAHEYMIKNDVIHHVILVGVHLKHLNIIHNDKIFIEPVTIDMSPRQKRNPILVGIIIG